MKGNSPANSSRPKLHPVEWAVQSGAVEDVLDALKQNLTKRRRRAVRSGTALAILTLVAAFWAVPYVRDTQSIATKSAQRQTLTLADGSRADLNAQTAVFTDFRRGRRVVRLDRGEAFFVVAKDTAHPFLVETPAGVVRVTGTEFNVRLAARGEVEVTLVEGAVELGSARAEPTSSSVPLLAGQQATLAGAGAAVRTLSELDIERATAWRAGRAFFAGETLAEATERFATFHGIMIEVDAETASLRVGGSYPLHELKEFLNALESTLPVKVFARGDGHYRIGRK